jgi:hypothetical protein
MRRSWPIRFARVLAKTAVAVGIGFALLSAVGGPLLFYFGALLGSCIVLGGLVLAVLARGAELREIERTWRE